MDGGVEDAHQLIHQRHQPLDGFNATSIIKSDILESSCLPRSGESPGKTVYLLAQILAALLGLKLCATSAH